MPARNSDGTIRRANVPVKLTAKTVRARWVEAEVIARKRRGISFEAIAEQITQIGRGQLQPLVVLQGVEFPPDYKISFSACAQAYKKGRDRLPVLEAAQMRDLFTERYEDLYRAAQPGVLANDPAHIKVAADVTDKSAKLNGVIAPTKIEAAISGGLTVEAMDKLIAEYEKNVQQQRNR